MTILNRKEITLNTKDGDFHRTQDELNTMNNRVLMALVRDSLFDYDTKTRAWDILNQRGTIKYLDKLNKTFNH